jgi:CRISPR-associated protein Cas5d
MEHWDKRYCLEVRGDFACFTRPEMKVERVSYDVITPSAARAIFEAIFWKPAIHWAVRKIEVLNPIQWTSVRRNEVGAVMSGKDGLFVEDHRQQRAGLLLRDVAYRLHADLVFIPPGKRYVSPRPLPESLEDPEERVLRGKDENPGKYQAMFERRARKGQAPMRRAGLETRAWIETEQHLQQCCVGRVARASKPARGLKQPSDLAKGRGNQMRVFLRFGGGYAS